MKNKKENKKNSKATNLIHGQVSINNGDVTFGARKDTKDVETSIKGKKNPPILTIPKGEKIENSEKKIEKIIEDIKTNAEKNKIERKNKKEKK